MIEVVIKAAPILKIKFHELQIFFQYRMTTARIAPSWIEIVKVFRNSVDGIFSQALAIIICAVEDIGRNSVRPSIMPKIRL
jgi:hypothetical protein